jgi:uncharacterized protein YbcI
MAKVEYQMPYLFSKIASILGTIAVVSVCSPMFKDYLNNVNFQIASSFVGSIVFFLLYNIIKNTEKKYCDKEKLKTVDENSNQVRLKENQLYQELNEKAMICRHILKRIKTF